MSNVTDKSTSLMPQTPINYIMAQPAERQEVLSAIHSIILENDTTVVAVVEPMMRQEMIVYKCNGVMKYGLAGVKKYMSLHLMPIYVSKPLFEKYQALLDKASFQKGCINFDNSEQMPLDIVKQLIVDCSKIDLVKIREDQLKERKLKGKDGVKP